MCVPKQVRKCTHALLKAGVFSRTGQAIKQWEEGGVRRRVGAGSPALKTRFSDHTGAEAEHTGCLFTKKKPLPPYLTGPRGASLALETLSHK